MGDVLGSGHQVRVRHVLPLPPTQLRPHLHQVHLPNLQAHHRSGTIRCQVLLQYKTYMSIALLNDYMLSVHYDK